MRVKHHTGEDDFRLRRLILVRLWVLSPLLALGVIPLAIGVIPLATRESSVRTIPTGDFAWILEPRQEAQGPTGCEVHIAQGSPDCLCASTMWCQ